MNDYEALLHTIKDSDGINRFVASRLEPLLTVEEAAERANVHRRTLYRWIHEGLCPVYGRRKAYRVRFSEVMPRVAIRTR